MVQPRFELVRCVFGLSQLVLQHGNVLVLLAQLVALLRPGYARVLMMLIGIMMRRMRMELRRRRTGRGHLVHVKGI